MKSNRITALFISWEGYSAIWDVMKHSIENLKECYGVDSIVVSNEGGLKKWNHPSIPFFEAGDSFSSRLLKGLEEIDAEYVLVMIDDFYVRRGEFDFDKYLDLADEMKIDYLRVYPYANKGKNISKDLRKIHRRQRYAITTRPSIWRKSFLYELMKGTDFTPWDFEKYFNKESIAKITPDIYRTREYLPFVELVAGGKLFPKGKKALKSDGIDVPDMPTQAFWQIAKTSIKTGIRRNIPLLYRRLDKE